MTTKKKRIMTIASDFTETPAAELWMEGSNLRVVWMEKQPVLQKMLETFGVKTPDGIYYPKDGQLFFNNVDLAFANSSRVYVEEVTT